MSCLWVTLLATVLVFVKYGYGKGPVPKDGLGRGSVIKGNVQEQYQIIDGNCSKALASHMVFHDHVKKMKIPFLTRNATSSWHGDQKIYCLKVLNDKDESTGATALVKAGGVGHSFVTIEMSSAKSNGLEFTIHVFAK